MPGTGTFFAEVETSNTGTGPGPRFCFEVPGNPAADCVHELLETVTDEELAEEIETLHNNPNATETIICQNTKDGEAGLIAGAVFAGLIGIVLTVVIAV